MAAVAMLLTLTACSLEGVDSKAGLTVEEAKVTVLAEGQRLVSRIPEKYLVRYAQSETAHLLSCSDGRYKWPDQGRVTLKGDPNVSDLLEEIADAYRDRESFTVEFANAWDGRRRVIISADAGSRYYITPVSNGVLRVDAFSACFTLEDHQAAGDAY